MIKTGRTYTKDEILIFLKIIIEALLICEINFGIAHRNITSSNFVFCNFKNESQNGIYKLFNFKDASIVSNDNQVFLNDMNYNLSFSQNENNNIYLAPEILNML